MSLYETIKARRSVKHFDPEHKLSDAQIRQLLCAAALAPTSFNMHNRHFVAVLDQEVKERLKGAAWGQAQIADAPLVVVITGALEAHRNTARYLREAPEKVQEFFAPMIGKFYEGKDQLLRDEALRSVGLASMNLMLMAKEMDLDSCPLIGFDPAQVSEILGLDEQHPPFLMVVIGKALQPAQPRMGLLLLEEQVSLDRFGNHAIEGAIDA